MRIALINILNLGDNLIFLPVADALRQLQPDAEIIVLTSDVAVDLYDPEKFRPIVLQTTRDRHVAFWRRPEGAIKFLSTLRAFKPEAVLISHVQPNIAHIAARLSGARLRIGVRHQNLLPLPCLTHSIDLNDQENIAAQDWKLFQSFCSAMGYPAPPSTPPKPDLSHLTGFHNRFSGHIIFHPGASQLYQRWPLDRFTEVAKALALRGNTCVVIDSAPSSPPPAIPNLHFIPARDLKTLTELLQGAKLFVGNNSGPMHIAAALGIPSVIITGPSNSIWDPFWRTSDSAILVEKTLPCIRCDSADRPLNRCTNQEAPLACLTRWTVSDVLSVCDSILESGSNS